MALPNVSVVVTADTKAAEAGLDRVANKTAKAAAQNRNLGSSARMASGSVGNLTAQINDIGLMMASGQSPFLLAAQQGTQVNQVLGQMGGTGVQRLKAVGTAIMSAVSPMNLLTFGIIAGGAALAQWALSSEQAEDKTDRLADAVQGLADEYENLRLKQAQAQFGLDTSNEAEVQLRINELVAKRVKLEADIARVLESNNSRARVSIGARQEQLAVINQEIAALQESLDKNRAIRAEIENTVNASSELYSSISAIASANLGGLIGQADTLAAKFQVAAGAAWDMLQAAQANFNNDLDPFGGAGDFKYGTGSTYRPSRRSGGGSRGGGGGGGGGGASAVNPLIAELEAVQTALETQTETYDRVYAEQLETLQSAYDQRLLTQQEFEELSIRSHEEYLKNMSEISQGYHGTMVDQAGQFFGEMANAFQGGNEKLQRISAAFGAIEAVINAWRAYSQVLADPSLPWFAKIPAALGVLSAGFGAVDAIKGAGGGGGGAVTSAGSQQAAQGAAQSPLEVSVAPFDPGALFTGESMNALVDRISEVQGDRGVRFV